MTPVYHVLGLTLFSIAVVLTAVVPSHAKVCYSGSADRDRDGYAHTGATQYTRDVDGVSCPAGYVDFAGDCDDHAPQVHPYRLDISRNGIDDNCNGAIDDTVFLYYAEGNNNTMHGFTITAILNARAILDHAPNLYARVEVARLAASAHSVLHGFHPLPGVNWQQRLIHLPVTNLQATSVYQARVHFYSRQASGTYSQVGSPSAWYYTTTHGTTKKSHVRSAMLLKAFKEVEDSNRGRVGYRGTIDPDGTRYGASPNEKWCSEFYAWVAQTWLKKMGAQSTVEQMVDYFQDYDAYWSASDIPTQADRGDYLPLDTNDDGQKNHSAMFLAYDTSESTHRVWTVEGNHGNKVAVVQRPYSTDVMRGLGHILYSQLK